MSAVLNHIPIVGHVKVLIHQAAGDEELAQQARKDVVNATTYMPGLGQIQGAWVAATTTEEQRLEDPAYGANFVSRSFTRSTAATVGIATTVLTGGLAIGAATGTATALGVSGITGGVGSGIVGAAAAGAAGGVVTTSTQHLLANAQGDLEEVPREQDYVIATVAGAAGGALSGTLLHRTAEMAGKGGAMTAINTQIADALGVEGMTRGAVKKGLSAATSAGANVVARTGLGERITVHIFKPGTGWHQLMVEVTEKVSSVIERMKEHVPDAAALFQDGKKMEDESTMAENGIVEGCDLTLA